MATDIAKKELAELQKDLDTKRTELRNFRFGSSANKSKNVRLGRALRLEIARLLTELAVRAKHSK
jgi:ribosomal protein L29